MGGRQDKSKGAIMGQGLLRKTRVPEEPGAAERRKYPRYKLAGVRATLNNSIACGLVDIAAEGVLLSGVPLKESPRSGDNCLVALRIAAGSREVPVLVRGRVVREGRGQVAVHYAQPGAVWPRLLELMAERESAAAPSLPKTQAEIETLLSNLSA